MTSSAPLERSRRELARNVVAGGATTSACVGLLNPVDVLRIRLQTAPPHAARGGALALARETLLRGEGLASVWRRGLGVNMLSTALSSGLRQGLYPTVRDAVVAARGGAAKSAGDMAAAGFLSGALGFFLATPLFAAKVRAQAHNASGSGLHHLAAVVRDGPYRGASVLVVRGALFSTGASTGYDATKSQFRGAGVTEGPAVHVVASVASALSATLMSAPADVVLTRTSVAERDARRSPWRLAARVLREEGARALFRGWSLFFARVAPLYAMQLPMYEAVRVSLGMGYME